MNGLDDMNRALGYIEQNLAGEIDLQEVAGLALCSEYHFTRMFSFLAGVTLSEYVRRRRMTLAATELTRPDMRVIDVAVKYGYTSADSFTRAFKGVHGVTPTEAREAGQALKAYPRLHFELTIRGGDEMDYRIEEKDAFRVVGLMKRVPLIYRGVNPEIAAMWESLTGDMIAELKSLIDTEPRGMISASLYAEGVEEGSKLDHFIGVATTKDAPARFDALEVAPATWAVFTVVGPFPGTLQGTWARIYAEWFPSSAYELAQGPWLLWNEHPDTTRPDYHSEIWVPVVKTQREN